jgi:hypothetical protein
MGANSVTPMPNAPAARARRGRFIFTGARLAARSTHG